MNVTECIKSRRSIRKYKPDANHSPGADAIDHSIIDSIVSTASYSPSWKNTQITRYIAIEDSSILSTIAEQFVPDFNAIIAVTYVKGRSGFERDGSFSTKKEDRWQMFDAGIASMSFCLAAEEQGLGTVIMGVFDEDGITGLLQIPEDRELAALIAIGYPDISPQAPKRKTVDVLLQYKSKTATQAAGHQI